MLLGHTEGSVILTSFLKRIQFNGFLRKSSRGISIISLDSLTEGTDAFGDSKDWTEVILLKLDSQRGRENT